ncbi:MAG: DUF971 domain-containing protein [Magnetovibrio sp.]|nr:DUF971 domain-containing protein [Magnetovibrio sp.]
MNTSSRSFGQDHSPTEIRLNRDNKTLDVDFDTGETFSIRIELLRVESPSADVQGHAPGQKKLVSGKQDVAITDITPIGNYAIKIKFSDGHDSGYFTWNILYRYGKNQDQLWSHYLSELKAANLTKDPG